MMPTHNLLWALSPTGERRIVDLSEYEVYARALPLASGKSSVAKPRHETEEPTK
jgi:hypothetical protein